MSALDKIRDLLSRNPGKEYNTPTIADEIGEREPTVRKAIERLVARNEIERSHRGFYRWRTFAKTDDIKESHDAHEVMFHGLHMIANRIDLSNRKKSPKSARIGTVGNFPDYLSKIDPLQKPLDEFITTVGNKDVLHLSWDDGVGISIEQSVSKIEIIIKCSDKPLTIPKLHACLSYLEGLFYPYFHEYDWRFINWAVNVDHTDLWLEDITSMTLREVEGTIQRWYNKKNLNVCRREVHSQTPIPIEEAIKNLRGDTPIGVTNLQREIELMHLAIAKLNKQSERFETMLKRLTEVIIAISPEPINITF
jgi:hypothetical protein